MERGAAELFVFIDWKQKAVRLTALQPGGERVMFRMIFAIIVSVMEKTPKRERHPTG